MNNRADGAELRKVQDRAVEVPCLRMWLTQVDDVDIFALPAWGGCEFLEAPLPCLVELDDELRADVSRYIGEPR